MDEPRDEYGLPLRWRRSEPEFELSEDERASLAPFQEWCDTQGLQPFPAAPKTVYRFLTEGGVTGEQLYEIWRLIHYEHERLYWHTDGDPVRLLQLGGVSVDRDGTVHVPAEIKF